MKVFWHRGADYGDRDRRDRDRRDYDRRYP